MSDPNCVFVRRNDGDYDVLIDHGDRVDAFVLPGKNYLRLLQDPLLYGKAQEGEISARKLAKLRRKAGVTP